MKRQALSVLLTTALALAGGPALAERSAEVVAKSEIELQPLNPLRGDASPKAGVLWGNIKENVPTGTLIEFSEGFSSPPHIHNVTYRAVVIAGAVHNDDPAAAPLWMGPGSFWTQPAGEIHITAAKAGRRATAFLEILEGPYLVRPAKDEFDNGERPMNLEARNIVWLDASDISWIDTSEKSTTAAAPQVAFLWGSPEDGRKNGSFLKLPVGFSGNLRGNSAWLRVVLIAGRAAHRLAGAAASAVDLDPGSYFGSSGGAVHEISCTTGFACILYLSTEGRYEIARSR
ncbi:MAG: DUF4437 domain-containing protein [Rhodospirillales bacterium]